MTPAEAAEAIVAFVSKHPSVSTADIRRALRVRRQDQQAGQRLLVKAGRIAARLRADRRTLEWSVAVPIDLRPIAPRPAPDTHEVPVKPEVRGSSFVAEPRVEPASVGVTPTPLFHPDNDLDEGALNNESGTRLLDEDGVPL